MTTINPSTSARRRGFTLVELLVAMALITFIMVILTEAFSAGIGTFRMLKAQGDMQEKLRAAGSLMRDDLRQFHFDGTQKLSTITGVGFTRIQGGYFYIRQDLSDTKEGVDGAGVPSFVMGPPGGPAKPGPALCFTVRHLGYGPDDFFVGRVVGKDDDGNLPLYTANEPLLFSQGPLDYQQQRDPVNRPQQSGTLLSSWTEVGYFLVPTGQTTADGVTPLYSLRRRLRVVVPDKPPITPTLNASGIPASLWGPRYAEVSCVPDPANPAQLHFSTPGELATAANLQAMPQTLATPQTLRPLASAMPGTNPVLLDGHSSWFGDDIVITDVVSFNVRVLVPGGVEFTDVNGTYNTAVNPNQIRALEITIRVWDVKTQLSRQMTIVQDM